MLKWILTRLFAAELQWVRVNRGGATDHAHGVSMKEKSLPEELGAATVDRYRSPRPLLHSLCSPNGERDWES